jgi:hypothetical protein
MSKNLTHDDLPNTFQLLKISSNDETPLLKDNEDHWRFISIIKECTLGCRGKNSVLPVTFCVQPRLIIILVCSEYNDAKTYLDNIVRHYEITYNKKDAVVSDIATVEEYNLMKIGAFIHTCADNWLDCEFSSIRAYLYDDCPDWLFIKPVARLQGSAVQYLRYLQSSVDT